MKPPSLILRAHEVRGILDGSVTQLRRIVKPQPELVPEDSSRGVLIHESLMHKGWNLLVPSVMHSHSPFGAPGSVLWCKETWGIDPNDYGYPDEEQRHFVHYRADWPPDDQRFHWGWNSSVHMPQRFSRISLSIEAVKVQRVQDVTEDDAVAENWAGGLKVGDGANIKSEEFGRTLPLPCYHYAGYWRDTYGMESWNTSPWTWVAQVKRRKQP